MINSYRSTAASTGRPVTEPSTAYEGKGISRVHKKLIKPDNSTDTNSDLPNYIVFVNGSYPGDTVNAKLKKIKNSYSEANLVDVIKPSEFRVQARCKYFGTCGGCKQQDLKYEMQIVYKQEQVKEIFEHIGGLREFEVEDILPSENIFFYRNKMEFSFADKRWLTKEELGNEIIIDRNFALGLHIPRIFDKVLDIEECFLQSEISNEMVSPQTGSPATALTP